MPHSGSIHTDCGIATANRIYMVTMEYAGVAEAGGVKLVSRSLCEELSRQGWDVTVVMPMFGCTQVNGVTDKHKRIDIMINGKVYRAGFASAIVGGIKIIFVCAEPFAKKRAVYTYTAEEEAACPAHKAGTGHRDVLLLDTLLCKAAAYVTEHPISGGAPDIVLCQDAACACVPAYVHLPNLHCVVTIHNAAPAYHHGFSSLDEAVSYTGLPQEVLCGAFNGRTVEPYLLAAECAALTTVSEQYAQELTDKNNDDATEGLSTAFCSRGINITGILNGIDYSRYDPAGGNSLLPYKFDAIKGDFAGKMKCREQLFANLGSDRFDTEPVACASFCKEAGHHDCGVHVQVSRASERQKSFNDRSTVFCFHGRMVHQKGIQVLCHAMRLVLEQRQDLLFLAMGQGEAELEEMMSALVRDFSQNAVYIKGYDQSLSRLVIASSDFIVLPSIAEPCGQEDYIAQIYGTLPVAHATGGLQKIIDGKTGFLYSPNTPQTLAATICRMIDLKTADAPRLKSMAQDAARSVRENHSWRTVVEMGYLPLFHRLMEGEAKQAASLDTVPNREQDCGCCRQAV